MNRHPRRGFTLVEALAVLVLTTLLLSGVLQLLQQARSTQRAARQLIEHNSQHEAIGHALRMDLENLVTHARIARAVQAPGQAGCLLEVIGLGPAELKRPDQPARAWVPSRIRYWLKSAGQEKELALTREQQDLTQLAGAGKPRVSPIAAGLAQLQVAFWDGQQWQSRWPLAGREDVLPAAVKVTWTCRDGSTGQVAVDMP